MHVTHPRSQWLPGRRRTLATLVVAFCITLALAIGGTTSATANVKATPAIQANMPATTAGPATTRSFQAKSAASDWHYVASYFWYNDCREAGENGVFSGAWTSYMCRNGSWLPWDNYELWIR